MTSFLRKLLRLFVDDGSLAIALLSWCIVAGWLLSRLATENAWDAPVLALGCLVILIINVVRAARLPKQ